MCTNKIFPLQKKAFNLWKHLALKLKHDFLFKLKIMSDEGANADRKPLEDALNHNKVLIEEKARNRERVRELQNEVDSLREKILKTQALHKRVEGEWDYERAKLRKSSRSALKLLQLISLKYNVYRARDEYDDEEEGLLLDAYDMLKEFFWFKMMKIIKTDFSIGRLVIPRICNLQKTV